LRGFEPPMPSAFSPHVSLELNATQSTNHPIPSLYHPQSQRRLQRQNLRTHSCQHLSKVSNSGTIKTHNSSPRRNIDLNEILPPIPLKRRREKPRPLRIPPKAAKRHVIGIKHNLICAALLHADAVICEALRGVKVEDPQQSRALKDNDFILFVPQAYIRLLGVQPAVLFLGPLHLGVKLVQESVAQHVIVGEVELAPGVPEAIVVAFAREVEPFRVTEFVAFEVEVAFAAEAMGDEADQFVQGEATFDYWGEFGEDGHVRVELFVAKPH